MDPRRTEPVEEPEMGMAAEDRLHAMPASEPQEPGAIGIAEDVVATQTLLILGYEEGRHV